MSKVRKITDILSEKEKNEMEEVIERSQKYKGQLKEGNLNFSDEQIDKMCDLLEEYECLCIVVESLINQEEKLKVKKQNIIQRYNNARTKDERNRALKELTQVKREIVDINIEYDHYESARKKMEDEVFEYDRVLSEARERVNSKDKNKVADDNAPAKPKKR